MNIHTIKLTEIVMDVARQARAVVNDEVVTEYAERKKAGDKFPPVIVFNDGKVKHLSDGLHRYLADQRNGTEEILAEVREGTRVDAIKFAVGANVVNGLRRSNEDKRRCTQMAIENFSDSSDNKIADLCGVSQPFVSQVRSQLKTVISPATRVGRDGKHYSTKKKTAHAKGIKRKGPSVHVREVKGLLTKAKPEERGMLIGSILTLKRPVIVTSKKTLGRQFQSWFRHQVREDANVGKKN